MITLTHGEKAFLYGLLLFTSIVGSWISLLFWGIGIATPNMKFFTVFFSIGSFWGVAFFGHFMGVEIKELKRVEKECKDKHSAL